MTVFAAYGAYYDLLNAAKDYAAEAEYVAQKLGDARSILELGCGTGKHAELLAAKGFEVTGVDRSEEMLAIARRRSGPAFELGTAQDFRANRTFDAVISLFHVVSYQVKQSELEAMFANARAHLRDGGTFLFDIWYGPAVLTERPERRVRRFENDALDVTRTAEPAMHPNENAVDVVFDITVRDKASGVMHDIRETHRMRYFFIPELAVLLRNAGFRLAQYEEWLTGRPAGFDTWSVLLVATAEPLP